MAATKRSVSSLGAGSTLRRIASKENGCGPTSAGLYPRLRISSSSSFIAASGTSLTRGNLSASGPSAESTQWRSREDGTAAEPSSLTQNGDEPVHHFV